MCSLANVFGERKKICTSASELGLLLVSAVSRYKHLLEREKERERERCIRDRKSMCEWTWVYISCMCTTSISLDTAYPSIETHMDLYRQVYHTGQDIHLDIYIDLYRECLCKYVGRT